jgi:hypothetical protein
MKMFLHKVVMRVVFTIAVISASFVTTVCDRCMACLFADKHTQENFEVGDKTSHMEFASILQEVKTVKTYKAVRCYGCRKYVCILTVLQKQTRHSAYYCSR